MTSPTEQSDRVAVIAQEIMEMIKSEVPVANLTPESTLQEGGMDSLRVMSLVLRIEARYDIELDADDGGDLNTVRDLAQLVLRRIENQP
ncbi:acyl carrier protein [Mycolicibacterium thermoresistibile]